MWKASVGSLASRGVGGRTMPAASLRAMGPPPHLQGTLSELLPPEIPAIPVIPVPGMGS